MIKQKIRFGLVGAGSIAQAYTQAFTDCTDAELVAIADVRLAAAQTLAAQVHCPCFDSHHAMAENVALDAVIVCTPPNSHPEISIYFLERNIHVLCEKPLSIDVASARNMIASAERSQAMLTMGSKFRYAEDVVAAKKIIASGLLGEIVLFENAFTGRVDMSNRWNANPVISGGGVLIDNGTHSVDIMRYFLGPLSDVQVVEGKRIQGLPVEDTVRIFVKSTSGIVGNIDLSWSLNKELDWYLRVYGSNGTLSVGWQESKYRQSTDQDWIVFGKGYNKIQSFRSQIENFAKAIRQEEPLVITAEDALASVEVIDAAYAALSYSRWTSVAFGDRQANAVTPKTVVGNPA